MSLLILLFFLFFVLFLLLRLMQAFPLRFPKPRFSPSQLVVLYGGPGSGKSTLLTLWARQYMLAGYPVYSNVPIKDAYILSVDDIGKWKIPPGSVLIVDEIGSEMNNRDFKNRFQGTKNKDGSVTPSMALKWWKQHRHEEVMCFCASQMFDDMDKKISSLGTSYYIVRHFPFKIPIIMARELKKKPDLDEITHQPIDGFYYKKWASKFCYAPSVWRFFDSFSKLDLPEKEWRIYGQDVSTDLEDWIFSEGSCVSSTGA